MTFVHKDNYYELRMTKEKGMARVFLTTIFLFVLISLSLLFPHQAKAFSLQQISSPITSVLITLGERVQYIFAFTPAKKVKVLENQAQRRLAIAQNNEDRAEDSIKEYQNIKNRQNSLLGSVDDDTYKQIQEQTLEEQKILAQIGNNQPGIVETVKTVNQNIVGEIKNTITYKEGTTAGEAFEQKAIITYAPGTGPGGPATLIIEGEKFAPGTSGTGTGTTTIEGGSPGYAPGTSGGGEGGTTVEGSNPGIAPGTSSGGTSGQTVVGE